MTDEEKARALDEALSAFAGAAARVLEVWEEAGDYPGDALENYPQGWPSFDELVVEASEIRVRPGYRFSDDAAYHAKAFDEAYGRHGMKTSPPTERRES